MAPRLYISQFDGLATLRTLPPAAGLLASAVKADPILGATVDVLIEAGRPPLKTVLARYERPALLAFSLYTWNQAYTLEVAGRTARPRKPPFRPLAPGRWRWSPTTQSR